MNKRIFIVFSVIIILILLPVVGLVSLERIINILGNRPGEVFFDDYHIRVRPACLNGYPDGPSDSCVLIINDIHTPAIRDTLVYYPQEGSSLSIFISDAHKWTLVDDRGNNHCTSHFLDAHNDRGDSFEVEKTVQSVLTLEEPVGLSCFTLWGAHMNDESPYYLRLLFSSRRMKRGISKKAASVNVGAQTITWEYSNQYNYAILSDRSSAITDTLRWLRSSFPYNSWSFIMVGDTIVIDDQRSERPSCFSPLVVRNADDLRNQYPKGYKASIILEQIGAVVPVTYIEFSDKQPLFSKETIRVSTGYLASSPLEGRKMNEHFFQKHLFVRKE